MARVFCTDLYFNVINPNPVEIYPKSPLDKDKYILSQIS